MKLNLFTATFALLMTLVSCSNSEPAAVDDSPGAALEIAFRLNPADRSRTYVPQYGSDRELTSQEAAQYAEVIRVYVFKKVGSDYVYHKPGRSGSQVDYWDASELFAKDDGPRVTPVIEKHTYTVPVAQRIQSDGKYVFVGIGLQKNDADLQIQLTEGVTKLGEMQASIAADKRVRECFAGISTQAYDIVVNSTNEVTLEMTRLVAGVLLYVKNVPYTINLHGVSTVVDHMDLVLSNQSQSIDVTKVHGNRSSSDPFTLLSVSLASVTHTDKIYTCEAKTTDGVYTQANSFLTGSFVMPINAMPDVPTLRLVLRAADNTALRTFNIYCAAEDIYDGSLSDEDFPGKYPDQVAETCPPGQTNLTYDLHRNHLYSIGIKNKPDSHNPDDDDIPINLSRDDEIVIKVNPNWAVMHNMGIGEESRIDTKINAYWCDESELGVK